MSRFRYILIFMTAALLAGGLAGCAKDTKRTALDKTLYGYHSAIRWGEIDGAWLMVDPEYRKTNPMSSIERSRFDQYAVSGYYEQGRSTDPDGIVHQVVQIALINQHTQTEKTIIDQQSWRWDEEGKRWWLISGLPDFSGGR